MLYILISTAKKFLSRVLLIITIAGCCSIVTAQYKAVGYYPDWLQSTLPAQNIEFENLTHIVHAFAWPDNDGSISYYSGMFSHNLAEETHNAGKKILLAFGGWGQSDGFAPMAADSASRANFINNVVNLLKSVGYDGIDLDWEFPISSTEGKNLTVLVKELREKFNEENPAWLITMAVSVGSYSGQYFEYSSLAGYLDWFAMMGYDIHGTWTSHTGHNAPLYQPANCFDGADDIGIKYLTVTRKVPKDKLLLGVPFYGKEYNSEGLYKPFTGTITDLQYKDIASRIAGGGWEYNWDDFSKVPYLQNTAHTKFVAFDDSVSIRVKCNYVVNNQLGGVMIWALGQDVISGSQPLLETIGKNLGLVTSINVTENSNIDNFLLYDNYPNPFNPSTEIKFSIPYNTHVILNVYNMLGQRIKNLIDQNMSAGSHTVTFNVSGINNYSSGVYFYTLSADGFSQTKKMMLLK